MDRQIVYAGQVPLETDLLNTNRNTYTALGMLIQDMLGTNTVFSGLACVPTSPAGMTVNVNPGRVYSLQQRDPTAYSSLGQDTTNQIMKQGVLLAATNFSCPAPATSGYSINYLISAAFLEQDTNAVVLPYYNSNNPQQAFSGPPVNGQSSGTAQNTTRQDTIQLTLTAGVAAATGSQQTPAAPTGQTPLYVVTVAYGQATITASSISQVSSAPILPTSFLQSLVTNNLEYGIDSGAANTIQATFPIAPTSVVDNQQFWVKVKNTNTGATTFTPNPGVIAAAPVVGAAHQALQGGELVANGRAMLVYRADITSYVLESCTGAALQVGAATQSQHAVQLGQIAAAGITPGRLLRTSVYVNNSGTLQVSVNGGAFANASSTFTALSATAAADVECVGGGGGSGGTATTSGSQISGSGGGGAGAYGRGYFTSGFSGVTITCGAAGAAGAASGSGGNGGSSSFGSLLTSPGGVGSTGGTLATTSATLIAGGGGTTAAPTGGYITVKGGCGGAAIGPSGSLLTGAGANSPLGTGGTQQTSGPGTAASGYGSGGGGAGAGVSTAAVAGGAGSPGAIIVREYA